MKETINRLRTVARTNLGILLLALCWLPAGWAVAAENAPVDLGTRVGLFVDDLLIDRMTGVQLRMHSPVPREVAFQFDAPWENGQGGYATIIREKDQYRLYYATGGELARECTCVAFSDDGIHFTRPSLGLFEFNGSKDNNIVWTGPNKAYCESHNFSPFKDTNPAATDEQRYKAVSLKIMVPPGETEKRSVLVAFVSADGIHWNRLREEPIITEGSFDSHNTVFWDTARSEYVCYVRVGREGKRSVARTTSKDFIHWTPSQPLDFGNTPLEHFYTNGIEPYFRNPRFYVGFPMRFVPPQERNTVGFERREVDGLSDMVFMSSADGLHWNRTFMEAFVRPGLDPYNWGGAHGNATPAWHITQTSETEMSIYWVEHFGYHILWVVDPKKGGLMAKERPKDKGEIVARFRRGTLRLDGFASVNAPYSGGETVTRPLLFSGKQLLLNCATSAVGSIKVEVQDAGGSAIAGFALENADPIWGDEIARVVSWKNNPDLGALAGKPVRLRFVMQDADLYSIRFQE
jgi:hypothetical protein